MHDVLGITEGKTPVFVKRYAEVGDAMVEGVAAYTREVRAGVFPGAEHGYAATPEAVDAARAALEQHSD
jgi:3-methyl-2-oxobutanoate hydroxymethyltransferase